MVRSSLSKFLAFTALTSVALVAQAQTSGRGRQWVRSHEFLVTANVLDERHLAEHYDATGFNVLLAWEFSVPHPSAATDTDGIVPFAAGRAHPWFLYAVRKSPQAMNAWHDETDPAKKASKLQDINTNIAISRGAAATVLSSYPGDEGLVIWDEPKPWELDFVDDGVRWARAAYPDALLYTTMNAYRSTSSCGTTGSVGTIDYDYSDHVSNTIATGLDVISVDAYPFKGHAGETIDDLHCRFYASLESVRNRALAAGIPYWFFAQGYRDFVTIRLPSESEFRLATFAPLAYGFTGIQIFKFYDPPPAAPEIQDEAVLSRDIATQNGNPAAGYPFYDTVRNTIHEVKALGASLRFLTSKLVRHVRSLPTNALPWGVVELEATTANPIGGIETIQMSGAAAGRNAIVGFFEDDYHHNYFMLVDTSTSPAGSIAPQVFTVKLQPGITKLFRLDRATGVAKCVPIRPDHTVLLTIPAGTGDLFKLHSWTFAGIPQPPQEPLCPG